MTAAGTLLKIGRTLVINVIASTMTAEAAKPRPLRAGLGGVNQDSTDRECIVPGLLMMPTAAAAEV